MRGKLAIVRSMSHPEGNHLLAVHRVLTGQPSNPRGASDLDRVASRDDFPCYAAVLDHVRRRTRRCAQRRGPADPPGRGPAHLARPGRRLPRPAPRSLAASPRPQPSRSARRQPRLARRDSTPSGCIAAGTPASRADVRPPATRFVDQQDAALALLCNGRVGQALDLDREDPRLVDRYGRHSFGQSLLLARRLVEAGVPIVQASMGIVQTWDTHVANFPRLRDNLLPPLDQAVSALLDDLEFRGLLDETLVVMLGEFGRTPRISRLTPDAVPGRDHWPHVFPAVFAGAGVAGGQVIGKSDRLGAYPLSRSFGPPDLAATIYHALGVDPATELRDRLGRPLRLCAGEMITPLYTTTAV